MGKSQHQHHEHYQASYGRTLAVSFWGKYQRGARRQLLRNPGSEVGRDLRSRSGLESENDPGIE